VKRILKTVQKTNSATRASFTVNFGCCHLHVFRCSRNVQDSRISARMLYPTFSTPENCQSCVRLFILFLVFDSMQCTELGISDCIMPIVIATWSASSTLDNSCGHLPTSRNVIELVGKKSDGLSEDF